MRRVVVALGATLLLTIVTAGTAFAANCVNSSKPDGAGQRLVVLITSFVPEEEVFIGLNAAGRWTGGFADVYFDADGSGTLTGADILLLSDTFLVGNHSGKVVPGQVDPTFDHSVLPPIIDGRDPGGSDHGVSSGA